MKIVTAEEAINKIRDNANVGLGTSSVTWTVPESLLEALGKVYHVKKHPSNVSLYMGVSPGTFTEEDYGTNHLVEEGLIGKVISAHVSAGRKFEQCIANNQFPTFTVPLGVYNNLLKTAISNGIGYLTKIGLNTYADPRQEGCKVNPKAYELDDIVKTKPGITGYWQVAGRSNISFNERLKLESYYSNNFNLILDMKIFFLTFYVVFLSRGAE